MTTDRERWDERYRGELGRRSEPVDPFVIQALEHARALRLASGARPEAVDLAAGTGRHALGLARAGFRVEAWDVSPVALGILAERAKEAGLAVARREVDLVDPGLPLEPRFDLAVSVDFLDRPFWGRLRELVRPGGFVIVRTFTRDWPGAKPPPVYRLEPGEIAGGLAGFETHLVREDGGRAGLLGRRSGR